MTLELGLMWNRLDIALDPKADDAVYHIVHPKLVEWTTVLDGISASGINYERLPPVKWLDRVSQSLKESEEDPSGQMLSMWQTAVCTFLQGARIMLICSIVWWFKRNI